MKLQQIVVIELFPFAKGECEGVTVATEDEGDRGCGVPTQRIFEGGYEIIQSEHYVCRCGFEVVPCAIPVWQAVVVCGSRMEAIGGTCKWAAFGRLVKTLECRS